MTKQHNPDKDYKRIIYYMGTINHPSHLWLGECKSRAEQVKEMHRWETGFRGSVRGWWLCTQKTQWGQKSYFWDGYIYLPKNYQSSSYTHLESPIGIHHCSWDEPFWDAPMDKVPRLNGVSAIL